MISRNYRQLVALSKMHYSTIEPSKFKELKDPKAVYKSEQEIKSNKSYQLLNLVGLQSDSKQKYPLWEQLVREVILHLHSPEFREEFYPLIRNDEIHTRLFSLHLWLLSDRLKHTRQSLQLNLQYF